MMAMRIAFDESCMLLCAVSRNRCRAGYFQLKTFLESSFSRQLPSLYLSINSIKCSPPHFAMPSNIRGDWRHSCQGHLDR
jgi:hypothetical protein